jgi:hypothetical protein
MVFFARESLDCVAVFVYSARGTIEIFSEAVARTVDGVGILSEVVGARKTSWLSGILI